MMIIPLLLWVIGFPAWIASFKVPKETKIGKIIHWLTGSYPLAALVRIFIEIYLVYTLSACQEIYYTISSIEYPFSFTCAVLGLVLVIIFFMGLPIYMIVTLSKKLIRHYKQRKVQSVEEEEPKEPSESSNKITRIFATVYEDLRSQKNRYAIYWVLFLLRRFLAAWIIIVSPVLGNPWTPALFFMTQFPSTLFMIIMRPLASIQDNVIEIMNEIFFMILCFLYLAFKEGSKWPMWVSHAAIVSLILLGLIATLIQIVCSIVKLIILIKKRMKSMN